MCLMHSASAADVVAGEAEARAAAGGVAEVFDIRRVVPLRGVQRRVRPRHAPPAAQAVRRQPPIARQLPIARRRPIVPARPIERQRTTVRVRPIGLQQPIVPVRATERPTRAIGRGIERAITKERLERAIVRAIVLAHAIRTTAIARMHVATGCASARSIISSVWAPTR